MFTNSTLLALLDTGNKSISVQRIIEDQDTQSDINATFFSAMNGLTEGRTAIAFDGKYIPREDDSEYLTIKNYDLHREIQNAIINPMGLEPYTPVDNQLPKIKAVFVGNHTDDDGIHKFTIAFQKFRNDQYITQTKHHLFFSNNTFKKKTELGISVSNSVDCIYMDGNLSFISYFFAKQIFDLSKYYREATNTELRNFLDSSIISIEDNEEFVAQANSWERKKIASINDSGILRKYSAKQIKSIAEKEGLVINIKDKHIELPTNPKERRIVLGFLDEEVYSGVFSKVLYQTNSKRKA